MASAQLDTVVRHLRRMVQAEQAHDLTDAQLVTQLTGPRKEAAFAALVERHGRLVWRVCLQILGHQHDAEDAFQATFLILVRHVASIRRGQAVSSWLYHVAHRVALKARSQKARRQAHEREAATMPHGNGVPDLAWSELQQVLDDELRDLPEKYRAPFVLCCLEGHTRAEAAALLGWKDGTVAGRLAQARKTLQERLARKGITLSAVLCATALALEASAAPPPLPSTMITGAAPTRAATLAEGVCKTMFTTKAKLTTTLTLLAALLIGTGLLAYRALATEQPAVQPSKKIGAPPTVRHVEPVRADAEGDLEIKGTVRGDDGKPVAGVSVVVPAFEKLTTKTGDDGAFHFKMSMKEVLANSPDGSVWQWAQVIARKDGYGIAFKAVNERDKEGKLDLKLSKDDVPVEGRILDLEGRPVAGATVRVVRLNVSMDGSLDLFLKAWPDGPGEAIVGGSRMVLPVKQGEKPEQQAGPNWRRLWQPGKVGLFPTLTTDKDGKFKLTGVGRERLVEIEVAGPTVAREELRVITRKGVDLKALNKPNPNLKQRMVVGAMPFGTMPTLYGPSFEHLTEPTKPIHGTVTDKATGKPVAGVRVIGVNDNRKFGIFNVEAVTDDKGEYKLVGMSKARTYTVTADPKEGGVYLPGQKPLDDTEGLKPMRADVELTRGVVVEGRLLDKATGKPVRGRVHYMPLPDNKFTIGPPSGLVDSLVGNVGWVKPDGKFKGVVYPGPGVLYATSDAGEYLPVFVTEEDRKKGFEPGFNPAAVGRRIVHDANAYKIVEPDEKTESLKVDLEFVTGGKLTGKLEGPDGKPVPGVRAMPVSGQPFNSFSRFGLRPQADQGGGRTPSWGSTHGTRSGWSSSTASGGSRPSSSSRGMRRKAPASSSSPGLSCAAGCWTPTARRWPGSPFSWSTSMGPGSGCTWTALAGSWRRASRPTPRGSSPATEWCPG